MKILEIRKGQVECWAVLQLTNSATISLYLHELKDFLAILPEAISQLTEANQKHVADLEPRELLLAYHKDQVLQLQGGQLDISLEAWLANMGVRLMDVPSTGLIYNTE